MPVSLGTNNHWECYSIFMAPPPLWQERRARQERARRAGGERKEKGRMKVIWYRIEMCLANSECVAWSFGIPLCGGSTAPLCWLKGTSENSEENYCRISGIVSFSILSLALSLFLLLLIFSPSLSLTPCSLSLTHSFNLSSCRITIHANSSEVHSVRRNKCRCHRRRSLRCWNKDQYPSYLLFIFFFILFLSRSILFFFCLVSFILSYTECKVVDPLESLLVHYRYLDWLGNGSKLLWNAKRQFGMLQKNKIQIKNKHKRTREQESKRTQEHKNKRTKRAK